MEPVSSSRPLLPVRMLNEFVYCPRLFHLMHVEGRWADNHFTVEGREVHRRVDRLDHVLPNVTPNGNSELEEATDAGDEPPTISRSVSLSSLTLGLSAKLDLVATAGDDAVPVETKRGRVPDRPERSHEPERVQLMAQGLLLREQGYHCDHGFLYFAGSRTRVEIEFTAALETATRDAIARAHMAAECATLPTPLEDSPKCNGCSLSGICMPDETLALAAGTPPEGTREPRRLYPVRDEAKPVYVQEQGATIGKTGRSLVVRQKGKELARFRLIDTSQVVICGNVQITTQTMHLLCEAGIPIVHLSRGNWFYGVTHGINLRNAYDRAAQFRAAADTDRSLAFAKSIVRAKISNQRTLLRRNGSGLSANALDPLERALEALQRVAAVDELLGYEGQAAAGYFANFAAMLKPRNLSTEWRFDRRNRRPPRDPINAMLSFVYALLAKELTTAILAEGLDPWWGLFHRPRHGRPSLALDLMEEARPLVGDSAVISAINTGMVATKDFTTSASGCVMQPAARKALIRAFEQRLDLLLTHPLFGYRCSWRSILRMQVRLFSRWLRGDIREYQGIVTR